jgi:hypothetical protein
MCEKKKPIVIFLMVCLVVLPHFDAVSFGFTAHRTINRMAVFTLPTSMSGFFKYHIEYITERSIDPDRRAHAVKGEAQRHYIDIDHYGVAPFSEMPRKWAEAKRKFSEDTLQKYGILPWHVETMMNRLTRAFAEQDADRIIYNATHLGHYISDLCTPLHVTKYYNGRNDSQRGIHALWETRLVELYSMNYNYMVGRAQYISSPIDRTWELIEESFFKVDTIYAAFDFLVTNMPADKIFAHEMRGQTTLRTFSRDFSDAMHTRLNGMVERQMRLAVKSVGDFWYTAWVDAGQPDLYNLENKALSSSHRRKLREQEKEIKKETHALEQPNSR